MDKPHTHCAEGKKPGTKDDLLNYSFEVLEPVVLVIGCCITNHPKTWWLNITHIYYFTLSVDQESGLSWAGFSVVEALTDCCLGGRWAEVIPRLHLGQEPISSSFMWLLAEFDPLLAVGQRPPSVSCHPGSLIQQLAASKCTSHKANRVSLLARWKS